MEAGGGALPERNWEASTGSARTGKSIRSDPVEGPSGTTRSQLTFLAQEETLDREDRPFPRACVARVQFGERAVQHLLREPAAHCFEHRIHVFAFGELPACPGE